MMNQLASRDPQKAQVLALRLQQVLQGQSGLIGLMVSIASQPARAGLVQVLDVSTESLSAVKDLLLPEGTYGRILGALPSGSPASRSAILPSRRVYLPPVVTT